MYNLLLLRCFCHHVVLRGHLDVQRSWCLRRDRRGKHRLGLWLLSNTVYLSGCLVKRGPCFLPWSRHKRIKILLIALHWLRSETFDVGFPLHPIQIDNLLLHLRQSFKRLFCLLRWILLFWSWLVVHQRRLLTQSFLSWIWLLLSILLHSLVLVPLIQSHLPFEVSLLPLLLQFFLLDLHFLLSSSRLTYL